MATIKPGFHNPTVYPYEAFVQEVVQQHFVGRGFAIEHVPPLDLVCRHPTTGERWMIEAKGKTSQPGLDFRTALGQIITAMHDPTVTYAISLPAYQRLCSGISEHVRRSLQLHWLVVDDAGTVHHVAPDEVFLPDIVTEVSK